MGKGTKQFLCNSISIKIDPFSSNYTPNNPQVVMDNNDDICDSISTTSSLFEDSINSDEFSSSSDLVEDASSSSTSYSSLASSSSPPQGPLYELSELMAQLPIKRGLSKHFQGKSQSFTSLCNVRCIEDLAKKESPYRKRMKSCKSYGGGLVDAQKSNIPKTYSKIISKKASKGSFSSLMGKRGSFLGGTRPPIPVQRTCDV